MADAGLSVARVLRAELPWVVVPGLLVSGLLMLLQPVAGLIAGLCTIVPFTALDVIAAQRLKRTLIRFAREIPGPAEARTERDGTMLLRWPRLAIEVSGDVHRFRVSDLLVTARDEKHTVSPGRAAAAAREALALAGGAPTQNGCWTGHVPGPNPAELAARITVPTVALAAFLAAAKAPILLALLLAGGGGLFAASRAVGMAHARPAVAAFLRGLEEGGLTVHGLDLVSPGALARYAVHTSRGLVRLEVTTLYPRVYLCAGPPGAEEPVHVPTAGAEGRSLAARLRPF